MAFRMITMQVIGGITPTMTHFIYLFAILALLTPLPTAAHDLDALVDPIFGGIKPDEPGCNVGVIQRGELVYQKGCWPRQS